MATQTYLQMPLVYKLRKVFRYIELYGVMRTLAKVRGQLHMAATVGFPGSSWENAKCRSPSSPRRSIGIIGCGSFAFGNIAYYLEGSQRGVLRGVMDTDPARARSLASNYGAAYATTDANMILEDPAIELVYIASNHASHAAYAVQALDAGKHVHIEKPHVVTSEQLTLLSEAMDRNPSKLVFLGFNRPQSAIFQRLKQELSAEPGPSMVNWFVAGHAIDDGHWYFSENEGGRILGNLCHWTDLTLEIVGLEGAFPCRVIPAAVPGAKSDFVTSIEFADGSLAAITFSAKGHTFDGVRETLNLHKGNLLVGLADFKSLTIDRGHDRTAVIGRFRDHGHKANVLNSFYGVTREEPWRAPHREHLISTARLFLGVREAHQRREPVLIEGPTTSLVQNY